MAWIKKVYLYLVSLVALIIMIVAAIGLINMGLKTALNVDDYSYGPYTYCDNVKPAPDMSPTPAPRECTAEEKAEQEARERKNQMDNRKREIAQSVAMLIVAAPVFFYHWKMARKEV